LKVLETLANLLGFPNKRTWTKKLFLLGVYMKSNGLSIRVGPCADRVETMAAAVIAAAHKRHGGPKTPRGQSSLIVQCVLPLNYVLGARECMVCFAPWVSCHGYTL